MNPKTQKILAALLSALLILPSASVAPAFAAEGATLQAVDVSEDEVVLHLSGEAQYNSFVTANPPRLVIQLLETEYQAGAKSLAGKGKILKGVRGGQFQRTPTLVSRVVLDLEKTSGYRITREDNKLVVRLGADAPAPQTAAAPVPASSPAAAAASAPAAEEPAAAPKPKVTAPGKIDAPVGESEGMTTQTSNELEEIAARSSAGVGSVAGTVGPKAPPRKYKEDEFAIRGDILSRLPKDSVTLDFDNTDIRDVLKLMASKAKINIIYGPDVAGALSLHLVDVPFHEAFRTALSMAGMTTVQVGDNILRVVSPSALAKAQSGQALTTKVIRLNYVKAVDLVTALNQIRTAEGRGGTAIADIKTNSLITTESIDGLIATERLISQLDVRPRQVLIECKLVEVSLNNSFNYGIQWDYLGSQRGTAAGQQGTSLFGTLLNPRAAASPVLPPLDNNTAVVNGVGASGRGTGVLLPADRVFGALTFGRITNNYFLSATLTAAAAQGKVKVLSDPKIATLNNQAATINVTTSIPYVTSNVTSTGVTSAQVSYIATGITLSVTPTITADGRISLDVAPKVSQASALAAGNSAGAPTVDSRDAKTNVLVKDGETVVIGGLISDSASNQISKIPLLGDIPILGWLFKKKSIVRTRAELLIFVTPRIMAD